VAFERRVRVEDSLLESTRTVPELSRHPTPPRGARTPRRTRRPRHRLRPTPVELAACSTTQSTRATGAEERSATWAEAASPACRNECRGGGNALVRLPKRTARRWHTNARTLRRPTSDPRRTGTSATPTSRLGAHRLRPLTTTNSETSAHVLRDLSTSVPVPHHVPRANWKPRPRQPRPRAHDFPEQTLMPIGYLPCRREPDTDPDPQRKARDVPQPAGVYCTYAHVKSSRADREPSSTWQHQITSAVHDTSRVCATQTATMASTGRVSSRLTQIFRVIQQPDIASSMLVHAHHIDVDDEGKDRTLCRAVYRTRRRTRLHSTITAPVDAMVAVWVAQHGVSCTALVIWCAMSSSVPICPDEVTCITCRRRPGRLWTSRPALRIWIGVVSRRPG